MVMACIVMAYIAMACIAMANIVMAYIVMAHPPASYIHTASYIQRHWSAVEQEIGGYIVMACIVTT